MPNVLHRRFVPNPAQNRPSHIMIEKKNKCQQFHTGTRLSRPYLLISYTGITSLLGLREDRPHFYVINTKLHLKKVPESASRQAHTHRLLFIKHGSQTLLELTEKKRTPIVTYQKCSFCFRTQSNLQ